MTSHQPTRMARPLEQRPAGSAAVRPGGPAAVALGCAALLLAGCAAPRLAAAPGRPGLDAAQAPAVAWKLHVSATGGDDARDGLTPATAVRSIERALDLAGWAPAEILVAAGRYRAPSGMGWIIPDQTNLRGGWRADFSERRWVEDADRRDPAHATVLLATGDTSAAYLFGRTVLEGFTVNAEGATHAALAVDGPAVIRHNTIRHRRLGIWAPAAEARAEQGGLLIEANRLVSLSPEATPPRAIQAEFRGAGGAVVARGNTVLARAEAGVDGLPTVAGP